jgi:hypothetical protein
MQLPILPGYSLGLRIDKGGQQVDATPYLKTEGGPIPPVGWTGSCRSQQCDISPEKDTLHGLDCTLELCGPAIDYGLSPGDAGFLNWVDGYKAKFTLNPGRSGTIVGCCQRNPDSCGRVAVP